MKLFVWEDVLCDWTCGMAFAVAKSVDDARTAIAKREGHATAAALTDKPKVYKLDRKSPIGFAVWGGE